MTALHPAAFAGARPVSSLSTLTNDLRDAERTWQGFARFDCWPGGNPWADQRDAAAASHATIRALIADLSLAPVTVVGEGRVAA